MTDVDPLPPPDPPPMTDAELGATIRSLTADVRAAERARADLVDQLRVMREAHEAALADAEQQFATARARVSANAIVAYQKVMAQLDAARAKIDNGVAATDVDPLPPPDPPPMTDAELIATIRSLTADARAADRTRSDLIDQLQVMREAHEAALADAEQQFATARARVSANAIVAYQKVMAQLDAARAKIDNGVAAAVADEAALIAQIDAITAARNAARAERLDLIGRLS